MQLYQYRPLGAIGAAQARMLRLGSHAFPMGGGEIPGVFLQYLQRSRRVYPFCCAA